MKRTNIIWLVVAVIIILIVLYFIFRPVPTPYNAELEKYLKGQNDSLKNEIVKRDENEKVSNRKIDTVYKEIKTTDYKIIKLRERYDSIIHIYDTASIAELEKFFTDRFSK